MYIKSAAVQSHFYQRYPFVLYHFFAGEFKTVPLVEGYAARVVLKRPQPVCTELVHGEVQKLRTNAAALEVRLDVELFDLFAADTDKSLYHAVVLIDVGAVQSLGTLGVIFSDIENVQLTEIKGIIFEERVEVHAVIGDDHLGDTRGICRYSRS